MQGIGENLRKARESKGLTQRELARQAQTSQAVISDLESEQRSPTLTMLGRLSSPLGVSELDILVGTEMFEVSFDLDVQGETPWVERRLLASVPDHARSSVSVWPASCGVIRVRTRAGALAVVLGMVGSSVPGVCDSLPVPTVAPVSPCSALDVLVRAESRDSAMDKVRQKVLKLGVSPRVSARRYSKLWRVRTHGLSARVSMSLQCLNPMSPVGLFVPK